MLTAWTNRANNSGCATRPKNQFLLIKTSIKTVGIIGSGPAGATLASLLAMKGIGVTLFDDGRRPGLVVGESLIPAVIPVLRKLGLEERAAAICQHKPGVTFTLNENEKIEFCFQSLAGTTMPTYAYNAPRPAFDNLLDARADELGVKRVRARAKIEREGPDGLRLAEETLALAPWLHGKQPDLIVDSTGRTRLFAHTMEIPAEVGPRKDVAYFAHYEGFADNQPRGQVIIGRLAEGWCWRIPLRDCLSVGVVVDKEGAGAVGAAAGGRGVGCAPFAGALVFPGGGRKTGPPPRGGPPRGRGGGFFFHPHADG